MKTLVCKYTHFFFQRKFCLLLFLFSFVASAQTLNNSYLEYIGKYKMIAIEHQQKYGIPASVTLAQGLLESSAGLSDLAVVANNHFGIKCHNTWTGKRMYKDDDRKNDCFRSYPSPAESFEDHARFLKRKRYAPLFDLKVTDYQGWAKGLKQCGYATDPAYATKLIHLIERYELFLYDSGQDIIAKPTELKGDESLEHKVDMAIIDEFKIIHKIRRKWGLHYVSLYEGDRLKDIADEFGVSSKKLRKFNDLSRSDKVFADGELLYLQEKNDVVKSKADCHMVKDGDTPLSVAQKYGVKFEVIQRLNHIDKNDKLKIGSKLRLKE